MSVDDDQRERLRRAKLAALARDAFGLHGEAVGAGPVTGLVAEGTAVALIDRGTPAALAGALIWAERRGASRLEVLVDEDAPTVARLAAPFALGGGAVSVHAVEGAGIAEVEPEPPATVLPPPVGAEELEAQLRASGVEVVVEHGVVRGEVLGLEVARLVEWPTQTGGDGELHLEVGVGRFDRDATAAARPDESPVETLERAVSLVRRHRYPGAPVHPLQMLARSRWLRSMVLDDPSLVDAVELRPAEMSIEAGGIKDPHPAAALGTDAQGRPVLVVCSSGVDLGLVPLAADTRGVHAPDARLVLALPDRDQHPATQTLAGLLRRPAELRGLEPGWA